MPEPGPVDLDFDKQCAIIVEKETEIGRLQERLFQLGDELDKLQSTTLLPQINQAQAEQDTLIAKRDGILKVHSKLKAEAEQLIARYRIEESMRDSLAKEIEAATAEVTDLEAQLEGTQKEIESASAILEEKRAAIERPDLDAELNRARERLNLALSDRHEMRGIVRDSRRRFQAALDEIANSPVRVIEVEDYDEEAEADLAALREQTAIEVEMGKAALARYERSARKDEERLAKLGRELDDAQEALDNSESFVHTHFLATPVVGNSALPPVGSKLFPARRPFTPIIRRYAP